PAPPARVRPAGGVPRSRAGGGGGVPEVGRAAGGPGGGGLLGGGERAGGVERGAHAPAQLPERGVLRGCGGRERRPVLPGPAAGGSTPRKRSCCRLAFASRRLTSCVVDSTIRRPSGVSTPSTATRGPWSVGGYSFVNGSSSAGSEIISPPALRNRFSRPRNT